MFQTDNISYLVKQLLFGMFFHFLTSVKLDIFLIFLFCSDKIIMLFQKTILIYHILEIVSIVNSEY